MSTLSSLEFIPKEYIKNLVAIIKGERSFNRDNGEWVEPTTPARTNFEGAILPLSSRDLNQLQIKEDGIFSVNDKKLYTDKVFLNRTQIIDGRKNYETYVAKDYDIINSGFRIYYIKKIDKVDR